MYSTIFEKNDCMKLYYAFLKHKNLKYPEFIATINKELNKNYDINDLKRYIVHIKKYRSITNGEIMDGILRYTLSKDNTKKIVNNFVNRDFNGRINMENKINLEEKINYLNENMDLVLSENKSASDLYKEGKIKNQDLFTEIKKYVKHLDKDKYIDFLIANHDLKIYTKEDLDQFLLVLDYFIDNLNKKLEIFNEYNTLTDEDKIRNFHVSDEENLSDMYKNSIQRLYTWKKQKLERLSKVYKELYNIVSDVIETSSIKNFHKLTANSRQIIGEDEEFVLECYDELKAISDEYKNSVKSLNYVSDSDKLKISDIYMKKLIMGNNK